MHDRSNLADVQRRRGYLDEAEKYARRSLELSLELGDRMVSVFATAELAAAAALRGDAAPAGRLWGAIESEESAAPIGQWPGQRAEYEEAVMRAAGPEFERGREEGRVLSLAEAAGLEPPQTLP